MNSYHSTPEKWQKEKNTTQQMVKSNGYNKKICENQLTTRKTNQDTNKIWWAKFTYTGKEVRAIAKLFKNTIIKIAYSTNSTIEKILTTRHQQTKCKYEKCGICQITCPVCNMKYIGQTESLFKVRFRNTSMILNTEKENLDLPNT